MKKNRTLSTLLATLSLTLLSGCTTTQTDVVATLFPHYDLARVVGGDKLTVSLITPLGSTVHGYEPTARDITSVRDSKLFLTTSEIMEPWTKEIKSSEGINVNMSKSYEFVAYPSGNLNIDLVHYWTDPLIMLQMLNKIRDNFIIIDADNADYYTANALSYYEEIYAVHSLLDECTKNLTNNNIFFYGHNALAPYGERYRLNIISLSKDYKPDAVVTPQQITNLMNEIKKNNAKYMFVEELIDLKAANTMKTDLAKEGYDIEILELHGFHNISKQQYSEGVRYVDLLRQNYENIKKALN